MKYGDLLLFLEVDHLRLSKGLVRTIGFENAGMFCELVDEYSYYIKNNKIQDDWFFSTAENIEKRTLWKRDKQETMIKKLIELGLLEKKVAGIPAKRYFKLNIFKAENIIKEYHETSFGEKRKLDCGNNENCDATLAETNKGISKEETLKRNFNEEKNTKKENPIFSEKEILFENFYKLYNNKTEITEQTKQTKGYNKLKEKFLKEVKTAKEEDILQGTRDYLSFIAFEHKRGFNRPLKDIQTFINQSGWEGDKGIPWSEVIQNNSKTYTQTQQYTQSKQNNQSKVDYDFDTKKDFDALFNN